MADWFYCRCLTDMSLRLWLNPRISYQSTTHLRTYDDTPPIPLSWTWTKQSYLQILYTLIATKLTMGVGEALKLRGLQTVCVNHWSVARIGCCLPVLSYTYFREKLCFFRNNCPNGVDFCPTRGTAALPAPPSILCLWYWKPCPLFPY